jgi:hypothetical protein
MSPGSNPKYIASCGDKVGTPNVSLADFREGIIGSGWVMTFRSLADDIKSLSFSVSDTTCEEKTNPLPLGSRKCP